MNCIYMFWLLTYSIYLHSHLAKEVVEILAFLFQGKVIKKHQNYMISPRSHSVSVLLTGLSISLGHPSSK